MGEAAARPIPTGNRALGFADLVGAHTLEIIVLGVVLADVVEAQEAPVAGPVEIGRLQRRLIFPRLGAARDRAMRPRPFDPPVHP